MRVNETGCRPHITLERLSASLRKNTVSVQRVSLSPPKMSAPSCAGTGRIFRLDACRDNTTIQKTTMINEEGRTAHPPRVLTDEHG